MIPSQQSHAEISSIYAQYCTRAPSPPAEMGWKPELALQLAVMDVVVSTKNITVELPPSTSTRPCLEDRWFTVSRSSVETIRLKSRDISGRKGLNLPFLKSRFSGGSERAERGEE